MEITLTVGRYVELLIIMQLKQWQSVMLFGRD
ncbi:hypothetical protein QJUYFBOH_CDS0058 [Escherichia phage SHIN8]